MCGVDGVFEIASWTFLHITRFTIWDGIMALYPEIFATAFFYMWMDRGHVVQREDFKF